MGSNVTSGQEIDSQTSSNFDGVKITGHAA